MRITYKDAAKDITVEQCQELNKDGLAVVITDGKDVTLKPEEV